MTENNTWYAPRDIRFKADHICFLIQHLEQLESGDYPDEPGNYTDAGGKRTINANRFACCVGLAAEVNYRLERTGKDGTILKLEIQQGVPLNYLRTEARHALWYCSGWRRKEMDYPHWLAQIRYRHKENIKV